jgi:hypothetical protein
MKTTAIGKRFMGRALAAPLALLMLALSVALPLIERADIPTATAAESEHDQDRCPRPHDHTVCSQVRANHLAPCARCAALPAATHQRLVHTVDCWLAAPPDISACPQARAPPSA